MRSDAGSTVYALCGIIRHSHITTRNFGQVTYYSEDILHGPQRRAMSLDIMDEGLYYHERRTQGICQDNVTINGDKYVT